MPTYYIMLIFLKPQSESHFMLLFPKLELLHLPLRTYVPQILLTIIDGSFNCHLYINICFMRNHRQRNRYSGMKFYTSSLHNHSL